MSSKAIRYTKSSACRERKGERERERKRVQGQDQDRVRKSKARLSHFAAYYVVVAVVAPHREIGKTQHQGVAGGKGVI